jgi:ppGpp synthetase/RelA/SpoT-type nucleotidyltranferase
MSDPDFPVSKTALDRLGARLASGEPVSDADLEVFAQVIDAYQRTLDSVKAQLSSLNYSATTRAKTTGTVVEKLRREHRMRLSQVQDLAGARIIVADRPTQDEALAKIRRHFEESGHACREVDRRKSPSHGYRAVHLVVQVGRVPVEIQIRTELEDTWAQIVERLADRWGRGIRYGQDPDNPDARVRAGDQVTSRRGAMAGLVELSDRIGDFELTRAVMLLGAQTFQGFDRLMTYMGQFRETQDHRPVSELPPDERANADMMAAALAAAPLPQIQEAVTDQPNLTVAQMYELLRLVLHLIREENDAMLGQLRDRERELRDRLQLIAAATDEGE